MSPHNRQSEAIVNMLSFCPFPFLAWFLANCYKIFSHQPYTRAVLRSKTNSVYLLLASWPDPHSKIPTVTMRAESPLMSAGRIKALVLVHIVLRGSTTTQGT